ncbi:hypothetical protein [Nocardiopsis ansamitocini]|uniref:Uncharacterized protein n=1 Tax=Nocardiopsis ansamitocini TaxID=1670832 RepID=A0A9W6P2K0_9ACTN|nr:hypothetical protein [Nocardiopsis ansamitocini]GLU46075.1 hypothetical protein Nans01_04260 [Nocardiopsis ansamitocini]
MAQPTPDSGNSSDIIDDALRLVDALQRKLIIAGVRKGVSSIASPPPHKGDVWEEAVKEEPATPPPLLDQVVGIARTTLPEVGRHLGQAGTLMFGAFGRTLSAVERSFQENAARRSDEETPDNVTPLKPRD